MKSKLLLLVAVFLTAFSINAQITSVAIVGPAVGGWPGSPGNPESMDVNQMVATGADTWTITLPIGVGPCKMRANNAWSVPGGEFAGLFPIQDAATATGSGDIMVTAAGNYTVTLNSATGAYTFVAGAPLPVIRIVGSAVTPAAGLDLPLKSGDLYGITTDLLVGGLKFSSDGVLNGGAGFPTGNAANPAISVAVPTAGQYKITYNNGTGDYNFEFVSPLLDIALIGGGTPIGWPDYTPTSLEDTQKMVNQNDANENYYLAEIPLTTPVEGNGGSGKVKFRQNKNWDVQWSGAGWPEGTGDNAVGDIFPNPAGTYSVEFVRSTKAYKFYLSKVGLVGQSVGGWDPLVEINLETTNGINYTKLNVPMVAGECKFRLDNRWSKAWGNGGTNAWPSGTASVTCPAGSPLNCNIVSQAGTFDVTFNRVTGAFTFVPSLATTSFQTAGFKVAPNPTATSWSFSSSKDAIVSIQVIDMLGKTVINTNNIDVDASALTNGVYFAKVSSANATETVKLVKN